MIKVAGGTPAALAILPILENNQAKAQTISVEGKRIKTKYIEYKGESGKMRHYLAMPKKIKGKFPAVVVIHENKGLQPQIEDVERRAVFFECF